MATGISRERRGEILKTVLLEIHKAGGEDYIRDILTIVEPKLNLSEDELIIRGIMGLPKWKQSVLSYSSRQCIKAGFIARFRGLWKLTDQGKEVIKKSDEEFIRELNEKSNAVGERSSAVMEQPSCRGLIDWFWTVPVRYGGRYRLMNTVFSEGKGFCQCASEKVINGSNNPKQMRAFIMIGVLIDQVMGTNQHLYSDFEKTFRYPVLLPHSPYGNVNNADHGNLSGISPNWLVYTNHGFDRKVDWEVVSVVSEALLGGLYEWFLNNHWRDEMKSFQLKLIETVDREFEEVNKDKLLPTIARINQE
jgi:hypothetical protein